MTTSIGTLLETFEAGFVKIELREHDGLFHVYYFEDGECLSSDTTTSENEAREIMSDLL